MCGMRKLDRAQEEHSTIHGLLLDLSTHHYHVYIFV